MHEERMQKFADAVILYTTWPNKAVAVACANILVEERLAACANIYDGVCSIYRWRDTIERAEEAIMLVKTTAACADEAVARISALHPYDTPVIAESPLGAHSAAPFLDWLQAACARPNL